MKTKRRLFRRLLLVAAGLLVAAQVVPVSRNNPPVESDIQAPAPVGDILRRACYDCHSNETVWPWYSRVAPASWLVAWDVHEGREHVNFSTWGSLSEPDRIHALEELWEEVESDGMPLPIYLPLHPEATLDPADKAAIEAWVRAATAR